MDWRANFRTREVFESDQVSYFISETMKSFAKECGIEHKLSTAYIQNGTVEVVNAAILALFRALISQLR
jgi:hypothetical protein